MSKVSGFIASCRLDTSRLTSEDWELIEAPGGYAIKLTLNGATMTSSCVECLGWSRLQPHYAYTLLRVGVMYNLPLDTSELEGLVSLVDDLQARNSSLAKKVGNLERAVIGIETDGGEIH